MGPGQYPQYTRALYGGEAVGSSPSETTEHTSVTSNEPNRNLETVFSSFSFIFYHFLSFSFIFFHFL